MNTILSADWLGAQFADYRVIIYENNSTDRTKELFQKWARRNSRVRFISEDVPKEVLAQQFKMKICNRTEAIARARNRVLDVIMQDDFDDFKYVVWADLDFLEPWDVEQIIATIVYPEQEWDAVFANGAYDLFALRDPEFPIGFELLGQIYWQKLEEIRSRFSLDPNVWRKVYSAFGGMAIYKREALRGCRYSGVVTKDLEKAVLGWLKVARAAQDVYLLKEYDALLSSAHILSLSQSRLSERDKFPAQIGIRFNNACGLGEIAWFSCTPEKTLPWTCEHIPFHASMAVRGHDKLFINPRWRCEHP